MFIPLIEKPVSNLRPLDSKFSENDWEILSEFWYPIAYAHEVQDSPVKATLLDVELVMFRNQAGGVVVLRDQCPHRHVRLSAGTVCDGEIICPFHGLRFNESGKCTYVPALGKRGSLPASYKVREFLVQEKYGLVWTCLAEKPGHQIPNYPLFQDFHPSEIDYIPAESWPVSAARQVENFFDLAHLPYVHAATLGGDQHAPLKPARITQLDDGIEAKAAYIETSHGVKHCLYTYRIVLPFSIQFKVVDENDPDFILESCDIPSPVSAHNCRVFQVLRYGASVEDRKALAGALAKVNQEDIEVLAEMTIPDLPLTQHYEIHLPVDNISSAYRGRLRDLGLGK